MINYNFTLLFAALPIGVAWQSDTENWDDDVSVNWEI